MTPFHTEILTESRTLIPSTHCNAYASPTKDSRLFKLRRGLYAFTDY
jgi:hypothetical protein